jgi:mono/diheme cytochrome c family protein
MAPRLWLAVALLATAGIAAAQENAIQRGRYLVQAGGCSNCHTAEGDDATPMAGGRALESPFGTFYSPNITPDRDTGIGAWTDEEFLNAFWEGVGPDGKYYFPAFPYTSYTGITREDLLAIKAYLFSLEPSRTPNRDHELPWYLDTRLAAAAWQLLKFDAGRFEPDLDRNPEWNRGAYLVRHLGHCGECHTPRDSLGGLRGDREMAGTPAGPEGKPIPNITPDRGDGIGAWSGDEITFFLELGMLPDGDFAGGGMAAVIDDNTSQLTAEDRRAIAVYLESLPPLAEEPAP